MKKRSNAGFSLAETLMAVLVLLLVSMLLANGVPLAISAFERVTISGNARVLLSTTLSVLRDELSTSQNQILDVGNQSITYFSVDRGATCRIFKDTDGKIMIQEYLDRNPVTGKYYYYDETDPTQTTPKHKERTLVSLHAGNKTDTDTMVVKFDSFEKNSTSDAIVFKNLAVYRKPTDTQPVDIGLTRTSADGVTMGIQTFTIRLIMPSVKEATS